MLRFLVLGFGQCRAYEFFWKLLSHKPVEPSRVLIATYLKHLNDEAADTNFIRGRQAVVCWVLISERFFKAVNV
jgi:hypothetical protein